MIKSRILWAIWILMTWIFWFLTNGYAGVLLIAASVLIPVVLGIFTGFAAKKVTASIQGETAGSKRNQIKGAVLVKNRSMFCLDRIVCTIKCENLMTKECFHKSLRVGALAKTTAVSEFVLKCSHCGRLRLSVPRLTIYDPFGIFRFRVKAEVKTNILIRPDTFPTEVQIVYGESMSLDSDEYSMQKAGFDPSETFAIREYMPGDRIKQIHWKLSEKMDNLMVREYGLPIQNTILLLLETGFLSDEKEIDAGCMDALGEGIVSLSQELIQQQIVHSLGWYNHEENSFTCAEISSQEDLLVAMPHLLGTVPKRDLLTVLGHYLEQHEQCEFAHVVLFAPYHISDGAAIEDQCLITQVVCEKEGGGGYVSGSGQILSVSPQTIEEDLSYMEI